MVKRRDDEELELFKKKTKLPKEPKKKRLPRSLSRLSSGHIRGGRRPNLKAPAHASTRPKSAAGKVTFHFALTYVSKGTKKLASKTKPAGTAAAHVKYIEREQAMAPVAPEAISRALFTRTGAHSTSSQDVHSSTEIGRLDPVETPELSKDSAAYSQNYVEDGNLDSVKKVPSSFGNTGETREERVEFWNEIEKMERVNGRVQYRLIVELPVELNAEARLQIMQEFAKTELESKGLGFWAVIHAPDKHNDARNYHGHLIFTDRPVARLPDGRWDFSVVETRKTTRGMIDFRHLKQPKLREMTGLQGKQWVAGMRKSFADISNKVMEAHKVDKRYDHRTYKEMGIHKIPTSHLGTKNAAQEAQGVPTEAGISNARLERSIEKDVLINEATIPLDHLSTDIKQISARLGTRSILFQNETNSKELLNARQDYMAASEAKVEAQLDKAERLIRIERRHRFLTDELATSVPDREYNKARRSEIEEERADLAPLYQAAILEQQADQDRIDAASQKMERALARMNSILEELKKVEADVNSRGNDKKGFDVLGPRSWYRDPTDVVPSPPQPRSYEQQTTVRTVTTDNSPVNKVLHNPPVQQADYAANTLSSNNNAPILEASIEPTILHDHVTQSPDVVDHDPVLDIHVSEEHNRVRGDEIDLRARMAAAMAAAKKELEEASLPSKPSANHRSAVPFGPGHPVWEQMNRHRLDEMDIDSMAQGSNKSAIPDLPHAVYAPITTSDREALRELTTTLLRFDVKSIIEIHRQTVQATEYANQADKPIYAQSALYIESIAILKNLTVRKTATGQSQIIRVLGGYTSDTFDATAMKLGFRSASDPGLPETVRQSARAGSVREKTR